MIRHVVYASLGCVAFAVQAQQPETFTTERVKQRTATVEAVDQDERAVVLRGNDDSRVLAVAGPEVQISSRSNPAIRWMPVTRGARGARGPKRESAQSPQSTTAITRAPEGGRPAGDVANVIATTVVIEAVDRSLNTVTFKRSGGIVRTVAVDDPKARELIHGLRRGDEVEITCSEAVAVELRPGPVGYR